MQLEQWSHSFDFLACIMFCLSNQILMQCNKDKYATFEHKFQIQFYSLIKAKKRIFITSHDITPVIS